MSEENSIQTDPSDRKKKSHVGLIILAVIVLALAAGTALVFRVPQNIGLVKSPADRLFSTTPDREKATTIMENLATAGLDAPGVEVYVLPVSDTDDTIAMIVLDASKGFTFNSTNSTDPIKDLLGVVSAAEQQGITRAAVVYYNEEGSPMATATVPTDAVVAYSQGKLSDRQLMERVDIGFSDLPAAIAQIQEQLK